MTQQDPGASRRAFRFEGWAAVSHVAGREGRQHRQGPETTSDGHCARPRTSKFQNPPPASIGNGEGSSGRSKRRVLVSDIQQSRTEPEQINPDLGKENSLVRRIVIQPASPSTLQLGQLRSTDPPRKQLGRCGLQSWLRRNFAGVEILEAFAPPGELDRGKPGLGRAGDDVSHSVVNVEQRVEGGPQILRPVKPNKVAITLLSDR